MYNRSAPSSAVVPSRVYHDPAKAIEWLRGAFGFTERLRTPPEPDGNIHHTQLAAGAGAVILSGQPGAKPCEYDGSVLVRVENIDAHCERARKFGARILFEPDTKPFGERQYSAIDLEGHRWDFSETVADVAPAEWGGIEAKIVHPLAALPRPRICYLEIPATDVRQSAEFYEKAFGWNIRHRDTSRPSFDDATGYVSGAWVTGRTSAAEPGLLTYIWVDRIDETVARILAAGGQIVEQAHPDSPGGTCFIATFRDPAGNVMGLYQETA